MRAQRVIVAIPPTLAGRIAYDPPLPGYRDQLTQRFPMGACIKCLAFYDEPFWRADGSRGSAVSDAGHSRSSSTTPRPTARPGSWSDSSRATGARARPRDRRASAGPRWSATSPGSSAPGPRSPSATSSELGRGGMEPRLLRRLHAARGADRVRARAQRADRADPLGRHRDRDGLERLHGRRDPVGRAGRARSARRAAGDAAGPVRKRPP